MGLVFIILEIKIVDMKAGDEFCNLVSQGCIGSFLHQAYYLLIPVEFVGFFSN